MTPTAPRTLAVTGATGFLGRALCRHALAAGATVVALVRPSTRRERLVEHPRLVALEFEQLDDIEVATQLAEHAPDCVVHAGWAGVAGAARGERDQVVVNVPATIASVQLAAAAGCPRWVGVGSQAEYGPSSEVLHEGSPLRPTTAYGTAKVAAAAAAHAVGDALGVSTAWARVFSVYGPEDHAGAVLPYVIDSLLDRLTPQLGPCTNPWDLLYVDDAAAALAALADGAAYGAFNVASGIARPLREAIELATDAVGAQLRPAYGVGTPQPLRASVERLRDELGWRPVVTLEAGIQSTVAVRRAARDIRTASARQPVGGPA